MSIYECLCISLLFHLFIYLFHDVGNGQPCPYGQEGISLNKCSGILGLKEAISMQTPKIKYTLIV